MKFEKPPLTLKAQVDLLRSRGLIIEDSAKAEHYLQHINYYRLRSYLIPFEANSTTHTVRPETSFDSVLELYVFDRELRLLLLDAIERFEVALRTRWSYYLAQTYGPFAHKNQDIFDRKYYDYNFRKLTEEIDRSSEDFVLHFREKYGEAIPPIWAVCEIMSFGALSRWYAKLRNRKDRQAISREFHLDETILVSFTHHLAHVRNLCAHHSRLWNRLLTLTTKLPNSGHGSKLPFNRRTNRQIYNTLVLLAFFLDQISPSHHWKNKLLELTKKCPLPLSAMGSLDNSWADKFWKSASNPVDAS